MLSISATLKETFYLWVRNFWYLAVFTLLTDTPALFLTPANSAPGQHQAPYAFVLTLLLLVGFVLLSAIKTAAILGLVRKESPDEAGWRATWYSIHHYTWTLFRVKILIGLIAISVCLVALVVVIRGALLTFGPSRFAVAMVTVLFLFLLKYALADPLVVVENLGARAALKQSWGMTKGHFWYVAGCYLALGLLGYSVSWVIGPGIGNTSGLGEKMGRMLLALLNSSWTIMAWIMYLRIKDEDEAVPSGIV
jgi:hypothetical protein